MVLRQGEEWQGKDVPRHCTALTVMRGEVNTAGRGCIAIHTVTTPLTHSGTSGGSRGKEQNWNHLKPSGGSRYLASFHP